MRIILLTSILSTLLLTSCGTSSSLVASWQAEENNPKTYDKLVVMAITPKADNRAIFETNVSAELVADSIKSQPSYSVFPLGSSILKLASEETDSTYLANIQAGIIKKIEDKDVDAILFLTLEDVQKEEVYVSGGPSVTMGGYGNYGGYYGNMNPSMYASSNYSGYYSYSYATIYDPGYYREEVTYFIEARLYDTEKQELIWVGQTKTVDFSDINGESIKIAKIITKDLIEKKVISPKVIVVQ